MQCAAPTMPKASFRWRSGRIKREDKTDFEDVDYTEFADKYVQVVFIPDAPSDPTQTSADADPVVAWTGVFRDNQADLFGDDIVASADQNLVAYGLEELLARTVIRAAMIEDPNDDTSAIEIDIPLIFNERYELGNNEIGNRSDDQFDFNADNPDDDAEINAYVFSKSNKVWTVKDIVEYLLADAPTAVTFTLGGQADVLKNYILPRVDVSHMTTFAALNKLIDRRRGLGWTLRSADDSDPSKWIVHVYTTFDTEVSSGDKTIPANKEIDDLDISGKREPEDVNISRDTMTKYGKIIVSGARILSMFTLSFADDTLEEAWTDDQETAYKNGAGEDGVTEDAKKKNDAARADVLLRHVYTTFRVPNDWDWTAGDGEGGDTKNANPGLKDGTIDEKNAPPIRNWGHTFERHLPIKKPKGVDDHRPEFEEMMVFLKDDKVGYVHADHHTIENKHPCHIRPLDTDFGFMVDANPNHILAARSWGGSPKSTQTNPQFAYQDMVVTVAVRTDEVLKVVENLSGDAERVKLIHVPDAELWYIVPGTVVGVTSDGKLDRQVKDQDDNFEFFRELRNDVEILRFIAAQAKAWYGTPRSSLRYSTREMLFAHPVGAIIRSVTDDGGSLPVNSVVSAKTFDLQKGTTSLTTAFGELDFGAGDFSATHSGGGL
jgi:hypothetical protein